MRPYFPRRCRTRGRTGLAHKVEGATALEFALIAPVFLTLMMAVVEFAVIMFVSTMLEGSTNITSRTGKTGYVAPGTTRTQQITDSIYAGTAGLLDTASIAISTLVYSNFDKIGQPEPCITVTCGAGVAGTDYTDVNGNGQRDLDMGAAGLGGAGDIVVYTITYPWPVMTPLMKPFLGNTFSITARTVVKNEPF